MEGKKYEQFRQKFADIESGVKFRTSDGKTWIKLKLQNPVDMNINLDQENYEIEGQYKIDRDLTKNVVCLETGELSTLKETDIIEIIN